MTRFVVLPLLVSRLLWFAVTAAVVLTQHVGQPLVDGVRASLPSWDAIAYLDIAQHGYAAQLDYHDAFLPGFPMVVRAVAAVTGDYVAAAWLVNLAAEGFALWCISRIVLRERDSCAALFAVRLVALAPTALFFTAPFTESMFIAAAAASLLYARRGRIRAGALAAAIASLVRLTGLALIPALLLEALMLRGRQRRAALQIALVPVPLLAYCAYMQVHTGHALAFFDAQRLPSFGQAAAPPWEGFRTTWDTLTSATSGETRSVFAREVAFGLLGLVACAGMWMSSRIPRSFALYCSIAWLMTASVSFWRSEPRYLLALFPAVLLVGDLTARVRESRPVVVSGSAGLMCLGCMVFAQGRWLG